ncbi:phospholipid phosphatase 1-like [Petromyzon marinus]|uniref:Phospholipid phosphatase 1-like n=1 Tax=Petromyzon marinus TaxID=7757 RepID=A0AAJ7XA16_PETMA|nr:phospholipid phosphatase 1-like [Petromyzon marinus]
MQGYVKAVAKVTLDILCIVLAFLPFLVLYLARVEPAERGFFCDDESIAFPYRDSTVSEGLLFGLGFGITVASVVLGEVLVSCSYRVLPPHRGSSPLPGGIVNALYVRLAAFLMGAAASQSLTEIAKVSIGRLRPHFLTVCRPDPVLTNCSSELISLDMCSGERELILEARKSFYSGHASFAMYTMAFLALYLHSRLRAASLRLLRALLQLSVVLLALWVGYSRVSDYKHHWSDVLAGLVQGAVVAAVAVIHLADLPWGDDEEEPPKNPHEDLTSVQSVHQYTNTYKM